MAPYNLEKLSSLLRRSLEGNFFSTGFDKLRLMSAANGRCTAELTICPDTCNNVRTLHGGMSATLVDMVSTYALLTLRDVRNVSVDMSMSYLAQARVGDTVIIEATTAKLGRSVAFLDVLIQNKDSGEILVKGMHTKHLNSQLDYLGNKIQI
ncbi:acyl-coenzyme A thioesterase 13-like [Ornithodoros turicata]|uniref:acyl-coenzyme A thioesterase 13-like n=1 Tax=Ornithodoros turicata TaxID=34597 RepID=UPI00313A1B65